MLSNETLGRTKEQDLSHVYVHGKRFTFLEHDTKTPLLIFLIVFVLLSTLLFSRLGSPSVYILDEARNAQCAREMMHNHSLIVPTFNGRLRTDKPPLHYYFMIAAYKLFGVSSFSARFFSPIFGLLTILLTAVFAARYIGRYTALFTTLVLSSSSHFLFEFRLAVPDPYFIFFLTAGMLSGFGWLKNNRPQHLYLTAALLALAVLAKGPVAILLAAFTLITFSFYKKSWKIFFSWHLLPAGLLFLAIALPWYFLIDKATHGEWTQQFFWEKNLERFSSAKDGHSGFFLLPLLVLLIGLMPFSAFAAIPAKKRKIVFDNDITVFSLIAFAVIVLFFSFSKTQLPNYGLPAYPFASIILGYYLTKVLQKRIAFAKYPRYIVASFFCMIPMVAYFILRSEEQTKHISWLAFLFAGPALISLFLLRRQEHFSLTLKIYAIAGISFLLNILAFLIVYPNVYKNNPVSKTLYIVKPATRVLSYRYYNAAYNFYLDAPIKRLTANEIDTLKKAPPGTLIITSAALLKDLDSLNLRIIAKQHDIFERRETIILSK